MDIKTCINKQVDFFKNNYCTALDGKDINSDINNAVNCAYSDAKRTMKNIGTEENTQRKERALNGIKDMLNEYFTNKAPSL